MKLFAFLGTLICLGCGGVDATFTTNCTTDNGVSSSNYSSVTTTSSYRTDSILTLSTSSNPTECSSKVTCDMLGKNCGTFDDGCGNTINCGTCDASKYQTGCGEDGWDISGAFYEGSDNVCGGGCEAFGESDCAKFFPEFPHAWHCAQPKSDNPPPIDSECMLDINSDNQWWCCAEGK